MTAPESPVDRWPLELRLVVRCLRAGLALGGRAPRDPGASSLGHVGGREPDWQRFLFWVERHRVTPLVYAGLGELEAVRIPDDVRAELRDRVRHNALRMLRLGAELAHLLAAFDEAGIPALPIKGPILALQVHGDITMRQVRDLDLLVSPGDLDRTIDLLRARGYRPADAGFDQLPARWWDLYRADYHEAAFVHEDGSILVEPHWSLLGRIWPVTLGELLERTATVSMAGRDIPVLGRVDLLIYLLLHGSVHAWRRLSWLAELARLIPVACDDTWERVVDAALAARVERPLRQGLLVARRLFDTPLPEPSRLRIETDRAVRSLVDTALSSIASEAEQVRPGLPRIGFDVFYLARLRRSMSYRLGVLKSLALSPTDVLEVALPGRLAWLYYPLRPLLWIRRRWRQGKRA